MGLFLFNDTATTEIYTLSLHDALPIYGNGEAGKPHHYEDDAVSGRPTKPTRVVLEDGTETEIDHGAVRSEEHTSELQSRHYPVCRLLLEKKKTQLRATTSSLRHGLLQY